MTDKQTTAVTVTIAAEDRRFVGPVLRELARGAEYLTVLNPERPEVARMIAARRKRLLALADDVEGCNGRE